MASMEFPLFPSLGSLSPLLPCPNAVATVHSTHQLSRELHVEKREKGGCRADRRGSCLPLLGIVKAANQKVRHQL
ncbi:hypothetical protein ASPFODRAFT_52303 [Aspergillus luchuensis CBS 106.47]|uniref:Uncharacterized protein n=1 Tax=Aspergillus luchuensis (strain CBS 106.47) TaxID=1137211 RepID=A0A1M3T3C4_ASPLC|nr:hypothetical protein ASPFODRAFT_52303 [Aspergillus luchuensis CBS 106.47]